MSPQLIVRSPDLQRLVDDGYEVEIVGSHLVLNSVPYVDAQRQVRLGRLVTALNLAGDQTVRPGTHVANFAGDFPCDEHGRPLTRISAGSTRQVLGGGLVVDHAFSSKPAQGYPDYYELMTTYAAILSGPAEALDPAVTARTHRVVESTDVEAPFEYLDTAASRAGITDVSSKLARNRAVIVGLGGTGSYVLDLLAKTPLRRIDLYDGDVFLQHNAFRGPGAPSLEDLRRRPMKVDHWRAVYSRMHRGIEAHPVYVTEANIGELEGADIVFLCMDAGEAKVAIIRGLEAMGVRFIDVGMGLELVDGALLGQLRVTTSTPAMREHVWSGQRVPMTGAGNDNVYARNIQVADLNALNACLAVIRWKKLVGFYVDLEGEHHSIYALDGNQLLNEEVDNAA